MTGIKKYRRSLKRAWFGASRPPSAGEAALRLEKHGPNSLKEKSKRGALAILFGQFKDFMIAVLIAAVLSGLSANLWTRRL